MNIDLSAVDQSATALVIVDLQNDFIDPKGAYARGGQSSAEMAALPARVKPVADALKAKGGLVVSTQFTLVPGRGGAPIVSPHLKALRPFLDRGDFAPGSWGQALVEALQPADIVIEKVAYSAFYMSRLEWVLRKTGTETLIFCGITTNGGVASTLRDAHVRDFRTVLLTDGCAAFGEETHARSIADLSTIAKPMACQEAAAALVG